MLALAGYPLGARFLFLDPTPGSPAGQVGEQIVADYTDPEALARLAQCDVVTFEFESVPVEAASALADKTRVHPAPEALAVAQDRLLEKQCFSDLGLPTAEFAPVGSLEELGSAVGRLGLPAVLKTRRLGYDGKGQRVLRRPADLEGAWDAIRSDQLLLERFVDFERELSILGVRDRGGRIAFYPLLENTHRSGILRRTLAPAPGVTADLSARAQSYARALLERLDYVGVLAVELFQAQGSLLLNEMAPRVHNSGHFSIEGATTSQFENHLRAILGLPLGETTVPRPAAMLNLVGALPDSSDALAIPGCHLHLYGKEPRSGRKVGHLTVVAPDTEELSRRLDRLSALPGVG